jgi:hypothetical protein
MTHRFRVGGSGSFARWAGLLGSAVALAACGSSDDASTAETLGSAQQSFSTGRHAEIVHQFDGIDDRLTIADNPAYALGAGDFTFEIAARVANDGRYLVPLLSKRTSGFDGFYFALYGDRLLLQLSGVPNYLSSTVPNLKDGNLHRFAVTRAAGLITFYVDGQSVGTVTSTRSIDSSGPLYAGYDSVDQTGLTGNVSDVRLWSAARSAAQLQSSLVSPPAASSANLIGWWGVSLGGGEVVVDQSTTKNAGYLGTDRWTCDESNPQFFAPNRNVLRVRASNPNAKIAGDDQCADILVDGTMEYFNITDNSHLVDDTKSWFCDESKLTAVSANSGSVGLDLDLGSVVIHVGANWENTSSYAEYHNFCSAESRHIDQQTAKAWIYNLASPVIVDAWLGCMGLGNNDSTNLTKSSTLSSDSKQMVLKARKKLAVGQTDPVITGFSVTGAACTGPFTLGATLGALDTAMQCTRSGNSQVFAVLTTDQGILTWDFGQLGKVGTAYATASVTTTASVFVRQDCTQKYLSPTCHAGGFLGLGKQVCARTMGNLSLHAANGEYKSPSFTCSGDCGQATNDGIIKGGPATLGLNFYVPPEERKYKKKDIPSVTYSMCANLYRDQTTTNSFTSGNLDVFRSQSFIVSVPGAATDPILHLNLDSGAQAIDLNLPGTHAGVTVAVGPANSVEKTYTVTVN